MDEPLDAMHQMYAVQPDEDWEDPTWSDSDDDDGGYQVPPEDRALVAALTSVSNRRNENGAEPDDGADDGNSSSQNRFSYDFPGATEGDTAQKFAEQVLIGQFKHAVGLDWLLYDGKRWKMVDSKVPNECFRLWIGKKVRRCLYVASASPNEDDRETALKVATHWRKYDTAPMHDRVVRITRGIAGVTEDASKFDAERDLLNAQNGTVDLRTGELIPHDPSHLFTRVAPAEYHRGAVHRDWNAALEAIPADSRPYMQLRIGQAITGHRGPSNFGVMFGTGGGSNGKSTFFGGLIAALGVHQYYTPMKAKIISQGAEKDHPDELMALRGARFVLLEELPEGKAINIQAIKELTQVFMTASYKHKTSITWETSHTIFINSNPLPIVHETDNGTWRRMIRLRWPFTYHSREDFARLSNPRPTDRLGVEGFDKRIESGENGIKEAVLAWAVEGAVRWYNGDDQNDVQSLNNRPQRMIRDTSEWQQRANPIISFCHEYLVADPTRHVRSDSVSTLFNAYMENMGKRAWSTPTVNERFEGFWATIGVGVVRKKTKASEKLSRYPLLDDEVTASYQAWHGVRWRTSEDSDVDDVVYGESSAVNA